MSTGASGWVFLRNNPAAQATVLFLANGKVLGEAIANGFRPDLKKSGIGEGDHAFSIIFKQKISADDYKNSMFMAIWPDGSHFEVFSGNAVVNINTTETFENSSLQNDHPLVQKLLKYGPVYAESAPLMPPVGLPSELLDSTQLSASKYLLGTLSSIGMDPDFIVRAAAKDTFPVPHLHNREGYAPGNDFAYWLSGYVDYFKIQYLARVHGVDSGRYFDFGGSTGRVFRNFAVQTDGWDVWACDFKQSSHEFNIKYFPNNVRPFLNTAFPALPMPDGYFDLITACSVFTHINETETSWLLELRRMLKIGGLACLSIHNDDTWLKMNADLRKTVENFRPDIANRQTIPEDRSVVTFRHDDPYNCNVFHTNDYIRLNWGRYFEICAIEPQFLGQQAMVVCRRTA